jgi:hypothetical protein
LQDYIQNERSDSAATKNHRQRKHIKKRLDAWDALVAVKVQHPETAFAGEDLKQWKMLETSFKVHQQMLKEEHASQQLSQRSY